MILWVLPSCLCNCKVLYVLFIRKAVLCQFFLGCLHALFPILPSVCGLWASPHFWLCLAQTFNEYDTHNPQGCFNDRNKQIGEFCLFISIMKSRLTLFPSSSLSWICSSGKNFERRIGSPTYLHKEFLLVHSCCCCFFSSSSSSSSLSSSSLLFFLLLLPSSPSSSFPHLHSSSFWFSFNRKQAESISYKIL